MIFTRIKIDNLFSFNNTELNLSFTRQPVNSLIDGEYLEERKRFYFKKVCILSGANASGKTSLGRVMLGLQYYIVKKQLNELYLVLGEKRDVGIIEADFVDPFMNILYRIILVIRDNEGTLDVDNLSFGFVHILKNDSCNQATQKLNDIFYSGRDVKYSKSEYVNSRESGLQCALDLFKNMVIPHGWHYVFSENNDNNNVSNAIQGMNIDVLTRVLKTFDPSIGSVISLPMKPKGKNEEKDKINPIAVTFSNGGYVLIDNEGNVTNVNRFSKGTYDAIQVSSLISRIFDDYKSAKLGKTLPVGTYYLDEKMAFAHTNLEQVIVALIVAKLPRYGQFFYTTHNYDILDLDFPPHSYTFTTKQSKIINFVEAISLAKKNDRSLRGLVKNNCFDTVPNDSLLIELLTEGDDNER